MSAPVGSLRWQLELIATMAVAGAVAVCPVWWAVALWWDWRELWWACGLMVCALVWLLDAIERLVGRP